MSTCLIRLTLIVVTCIILNCNFVVSRENQDLCTGMVSSGKCECYEQYEEQPFAHPPTKLHGLAVECTNVTDEELYTDISHISNYFSQARNLSIYSLQVKDSKLGHSNDGFPHGLDGLKYLTVDNTGIDLEQIRESSESLHTLKMFRVSRENFTEIPADFFHELHGLNVLALNDVGIKAISENGFKYLEDSLKNLSLRNNLLRSIPLAIATLSNVESIDLSGNQIKSVSDDNTKSLESGLKGLMILNMDTIECTCKLSSSLFIDWIRSHAIHGVKCATPNRLRGWDISSAPTEEFCNNGDSSSFSNLSSVYTPFLTLLLIVQHFTRM